MAVKVEAMICSFYGGPLDGSSKLLPNSWASFRVPTKLGGIITKQHVYVRDEEEPDIFIYEGVE